MANNGSQRLTIISGNSASRRGKPVAIEACPRRTMKLMLFAKESSVLSCPSQVARARNGNGTKRNLGSSVGDAFTLVSRDGSVSSNGSTA